MSRKAFSNLSPLWAVAWSCFTLPALTGDLWTDGAWAVQAPAVGRCESLPLLQVKGPGSIFDPPNASALAALQRNLPSALAKVCPGTHEVILVSGRTRRLIRFEESAIQGATTTAPARRAAAVASEEPIRETLPAQTAPAPVRRAPPMTIEAPSPQLRTQQPVMMSGPPTPQVGRRSELRSLSSVRDIEDKCEVLLKWLESGQRESGPAIGSRYRGGQEMLAIFRDEPTAAVFSTPYGNTENRWRLEQHDKVISRCLGMTPSRPNPFTRQPNRTLQQYAQQFERYRQVLDQSFLGTVGPYEPTAISRYLQQVKTQMAWANQAITFAASAPRARDAFQLMRQQQQAVNQQMSLLNPDEKSAVASYLERRQSEIAPGIADEWFREVAGSAKGAASAKLLHRNHAGIADVLGSLDAPARTAFSEKYRRLLESLVADSIKADVAALNATPASLSGVLQLSAWKANFDVSYGELRSVPAVQAAEQEYNQGRVRVIAGALPSWMQQVGSIPVDGAAITAKRREMDALFPAREDRSSPLFTQYEVPLRAKEDQLRLQVEAEMLKKRQEAAAIAAAELRERQAVAAQRQQAPNASPSNRDAGAPKARLVANASLTANSLLTNGLHNDTAIANLYRGDFTKVTLEPDQIVFVDMYSQYLNAFGKQCREYLPENREEITRQVCRRWLETYRGGIYQSRECTLWEPEGTDVYAHPELYAVKKRLDRQAAGDTPRNIGRILLRGNPGNNMMGMVGDSLKWNSDIETLVGQNGCASAGLARFEENLKLFALGKQPVRIGEDGPKLSAIDPLPGIPFQDQDYTRLLDDLVGEFATTWVINRYHGGSISGVSVASRDSRGRPSKIKASYTYDGFSGRGQGSLTMSLGDGIPECMYFFDFPASCRTPNRRIVAAYTNGDYKKQ